MFFSEILKVRIKLAADLAISVVRDTDAAGLSDAFQPRCNVHPVAEDIVLLDHNVADVDPDAEFDALLGWHPHIALRHSLLLLDCAAHGVHRTAELDQNPVSGALYNAAAMLRYVRLQKFTPVRVEPGECVFLVNAHQPAVASDIPRQNGRKPPLHTLFGHKKSPRCA
jgi:hypothetical protein